MHGFGLAAGAGIALFRVLFRQMLSPELLHVSRGLFRERDRQNVSGRNAARNHVPDAMGNDPGLARARPSQDQNRASHGFDRQSLLGIQGTEVQHRCASLFGVRLRKQAPWISPAEKIRAESNFALSF